MRKKYNKGERERNRVSENEKICSNGEREKYGVREKGRTGERERNKVMEKVKRLRNIYWDRN